MSKQSNHCSYELCDVWADLPAFLTSVLSKKSNIHSDFPKVCNCLKDAKTLLCTVDVIARRSFGGTVDLVTGAMVLLFAADDKFEDVIKALEERGWRRLPYVGIPKFDLKWTNYSKVAWALVKPQQIVNHFQNAILFSRKDLFTELLYAHAGEIDQGQTVVDKCFPRSFDWSEDRELLKKCFLYSQAVGVLKSSLRSKTDEVQLKVATDLVKAVLADGAAFQGCRDSFAIGEDDAVEVSEALALASRGNAVVSVDDKVRREVGGLLQQLQQRDPQFSAIDKAGSNVWICKPSNLSQGRGIALCSSLRELIEITGEQDAGSGQYEEASSTRWIVQKYIERPLLLQNGRKFDIRQWVLLTELEPKPVAFWFFRSYLRFCSRPFDLSRLQDRFTHLSNYSVQQHFVPDVESKQATRTDDFEPMWSSEQLQDFLRQQTHDRDVWTESILPQMQSTARLALAAVLPKLKVVGKGFEWLGFDFLVDENYHVWLLEVNVSPDVSHSTSVTAELAPKATVDTLNLVLDDKSSPDNGWLPFSLD